MEEREFENWNETEADKRLTRMIEIAARTGYTLNAVVAAVGYVDNSIFLAVVESPSTLPRYMKSKSTP